MGRCGENQNVQQWMVIELDFTRFYWKCYWFLLGILLDFYWIFTGYGAFMLVKCSTDMGWSWRDCRLFHWTPTFEKHPMFSGQKNTIISAISVPQPGPYFWSHHFGDVQGLVSQLLGSDPFGTTCCRDSKSWHHRILEFQRKKNLKKIRWSYSENKKRTTSPNKIRIFHFSSMFHLEKPHQKNQITRWSDRSPSSCWLGEPRPENGLHH